MTVFSGQVFDDTISGSSASWYTPAEYNGPLGAGDMLALMASVTDVAGTSPTLTVQVEHSADQRNWLAAGAATIATDISSNGVYHGSRIIYPWLLSFVRVKVTLGGTTPKCRLKLFAASRAA